MCQIDRPCLGMAGLDMTDTVCFFLRPCILMTFDHMIQIVVYRSAGNYACLNMVSHTELIDIIAGFHILVQISGIHQLPEKFSCLFIYLGAIHICPFRKICLRAVYPQKRQGMFLNLFDRLFPGKDIIGKGRNFCRLYRLGADGRKWFYNCHKNLLTFSGSQAYPGAVPFLRFFYGFS